MSATCGNAAVCCTFWNIGTCCCVTMSTSTTRSVCWLWWTSTWMVSTWCLLHLWHIDNFVDGLCLSLRWDLECDVRLACAATRSRSRGSDMDVKYGCRDSA